MTTAKQRLTIYMASTRPLDDLAELRAAGVDSPLLKSVVTLPAPRTGD